MLAPYPGDRLHNQTPPPPPASHKRGQPNRAKTSGSILDADPPAWGSKLHADTQPANGDDGPETRQLVLSFHVHAGIAAHGIAGPQTEPILLT